MAISETKMQMVISNYFKDECDVNTSIRQAFEKGFRIGVKKGAGTNRPQGYWTKTDVATYRCSECGKMQIADDVNELNYCCCCGSRNKVQMLKGAYGERDGE